MHFNYAKFIHKKKKKKEKTEKKKKIGNKKEKEKRAWRYKVYNIISIIDNRYLSNIYIKKNNKKKIS